jgi:hypothetical protein
MDEGVGWASTSKAASGRPSLTLGINRGPKAPAQKDSRPLQKRERWVGEGWRGLVALCLGLVGWRKSGGEPPHSKGGEFASEISMLLK